MKLQVLVKAILDKYSYRAMKHEGLCSLTLSNNKHVSHGQSYIKTFMIKTGKMFEGHFRMISVFIIYDYANTNSESLNPKIISFSILKQHSQILKEVVM